MPRIKPCRAQKRVFIFWGHFLQTRGLFSRRILHFLAMRGVILQRRCIRGSCFWASRRRSSKNIDRCFSPGNGQFFGSAAAPDLRLRCAHAQPKNRPAGGKRPVFPDEFPGFQSGNLLLHGRPKVAVKSQNREPPGTGSERGPVPFRPAATCLSPSPHAVLGRRSDRTLRRRGRWFSHGAGSSPPSCTPSTQGGRGRSVASRSTLRGWNAEMDS